MQIPKVIFQTSLLKPPNYLVERIQSKCQGWEYKHFGDSEIIQFIKDTPIEEFNNSLEVFHSFENGAHKADFFRYYYLYINGGVYMDSDAILEKDIDLIVKNYSFITVKSCLNNDSMFNGFICCTPKNIIIYQALKDAHKIDKESLKKDYFFICKNLYSIIDNYNNIVDNISVKTEAKLESHHKILKEEKYTDKIAVTKDGDDIVLSHFFSKETFIKSLLPIKENNLKPVNSTKVGITFDMPKDVKSLFSNGIRQNVLYFTELLLNIGYECYLIIVDEKLENTEEIKKMAYNKDLKISKYSEILSDNFDIIFIFGYDVPKKNVEILKYMNTKIVKYLCGNSYMIDSEKILYNQHKDHNGFTYVSHNDEKLYDQLWAIPQMINTNQYYYQTLFRSKCIEVPFIWSNKSVFLTSVSENIQEDDFLYKKGGNANKKIAIFEPNISIMKWCFPALLVCENSYRNNTNIERVFLNNITDNKGTINDFNIDALNKIVKTLDLFRDNKISIESRYNTLYFMKNYADIAVSHQLENPLNYLYFDLAWMGWPIVHNASLCKDVGYYYEGFNYEMGGKVLLDVILNHDSNCHEYLEKNRKILERYLPTNKELQEKYKTLIENLFQ